MVISLVGAMKPSTIYDVMPTCLHSTFVGKAIARRVASEKSEQINDELQQWRRGQRNKVTCLVLGRETHRFIKNLQLSTVGFTDEDRVAWRVVIFRYLCMQLSQTPVIPAVTGGHDIELLRAHQTTLGEARKRDFLGLLGIDVCEALRHCASEATVSASVLGYNDSMPHFLNDIDRILDPKYLPSDEDILSLPEFCRPQPGGLDELDFKMRQLDFRIIGVSSLSGQGHIHKLRHMFENVNCVITVADLAHYDATLEGRPEVHLLDEDMSMFAGITNSRWFTRTHHILMLVNYRKFRTKLVKTPLSKWYPEPGNDESSSNAVSQDPKKAIAFILERFNRNRNNLLGIYAFVCELDGPSNDQAAQYITDALLIASMVICYCFGSVPDPKDKGFETGFEDLS